MRSRARAPACAGMTLLELLAALALASLVLAGLAGTTEQALRAWQLARARSERAVQANFAMERMLRAASGAGRLLLPLGDQPLTPQNESLTTFLAVSLDPAVDRDADGFSDADNDRDGRIDEDLPRDSTNDGAPGIKAVDDGGNGSVDASAAGSRDDDESGIFGDEDPIDGSDSDADGTPDDDASEDMNGDGAPGVSGVDDDADGSIDEGGPADDDEDGSSDEDWYDAVLFRVQGGNLVERIHPPHAANGASYSEQVIAEGVTQLRVERVAALPSARAPLLDLTLELSTSDGGTISLHTRVRVGAEP